MLCAIAGLVSIFPCAYPPPLLLCHHKQKQVLFDNFKQVMKQVILFPLALLINSFLAFAQVIVPSVFSASPPIPLIETPKQIVASSRAISIQEVLDATFDNVQSVSPIKGFSAALLLPDGTVWKRAGGLATGSPTETMLTTEHIIPMASISKSFIALTVLLLVEDGLLSLDDTLGKFFAPYPNVPSNVSVRQLLSHRSGINDYINENAASGQAWLSYPDSIWISDTLLNNFVLAPNFPVGTSWSYSNTNFLLATRIIDVVSGQPWQEVVRARVLNPLGLTNTFITPWESYGTAPFAHVWADVDGDGTQEDFQGTGIPIEGLLSLAGGGGCFSTTPEDLARFSERLHGGHILKPATLAEMHTDYMLNPGSGNQYGLGTQLFPFPNNIENWGHDGSLIYNSIASYFPSENIALAVQQNDARTYDLTDPNSPPDLFGMAGALLAAYLEFKAMTAVEEAPNAPRLTVYPNPATTTVHLNLPSDVTLQFPATVIINDLSGRVVSKQRMNSAQDAVDLGDLAGGVYRLCVGPYVGMVVR